MSRGRFFLTPALLCLNLAVPILSSCEYKVLFYNMLKVVFCHFHLASHGKHSSLWGTYFLHSSGFCGECFPEHAQHPLCCDSLQLEHTGKSSQPVHLRRMNKLGSAQLLSFILQEWACCSEGMSPCISAASVAWGTVPWLGPAGARSGGKINLLTWEG